MTKLPHITCCGVPSTGKCPRSFRFLANFFEMEGNKMIEKMVSARQIRVGAERLRKIAASESDAERAAELNRMAQEMDEHAAEIERAIVAEHRTLRTTF
jgi:hypothetical protein